MTGRSKVTTKEKLALGLVTLVFTPMVIFALGHLLSWNLLTTISLIITMLVAVSVGIILDVLRDLKKISRKTEIVADIVAMTLYIAIVTVLWFLV